MTMKLPPFINTMINPPPLSPEEFEREQEKLIQALPRSVRPIRSWHPKVLTGINFLFGTVLLCTSITVVLYLLHQLDHLESTFPFFFFDLAKIFFMLTVILVLTVLAALIWKLVEENKAPLFYVFNTRLGYFQSEPYNSVDQRAHIALTIHHPRIRPILVQWLTPSSEWGRREVEVLTRCSKAMTKIETRLYRYAETVSDSEDRAQIQLFIHNATHYRHVLNDPTRSMKTEIALLRQEAHTQRERTQLQHNTPKPIPSPTPSSRRL